MLRDRDRVLGAQTLWGARAILRDVGVRTLTVVAVAVLGAAVPASAAGQPRLTLSRAAAAPGARVALAGHGLPARARVRVTLAGVTVRRDRSGRRGGFRLVFRVPAKAAGLYRLRVRVHGESVASRRFRIRSVARHDRPAAPGARPGAPGAAAGEHSSSARSRRNSWPRVTSPAARHRHRARRAATRARLPLSSRTSTPTRSRRSATTSTSTASSRTSPRCTTRLGAASSRSPSRRSAITSTRATRSGTAPRGTSSTSAPARVTSPRATTEWSLGKLDDLRAQLRRHRLHPRGRRRRGHAGRLLARLVRCGERPGDLARDRARRPSRRCMRARLLAPPPLQLGLRRRQPATIPRPARCTRPSTTTAPSSC